MFNIFVVDPSRSHRHSYRSANETLLSGYTSSKWEQRSNVGHARGNQIWPLARQFLTQSLKLKQANDNWNIYGNLYKETQRRKGVLETLNRKYIQVGISYWFGILFWVPRKERQFSIDSLEARHQLITTFTHAQTFGHCSLPSLYHQPPSLFLSTLQQHVASYLALVIWSSLMTTDN